MSVKTAYRTFFLPEWGGKPHGLPCDLGAWGFPPTSVPMAIIGQRDPACPFLFDIFMDLIKRPKPWFSFISPMIYDDI